ncbi:MAG: methyltransferase domain-containing protein [Betaproteobacteria bacterium]|nr:methyltransferase domain-containing protein [Betaproteobacteria bacterium]
MPLLEARLPTPAVNRTPTWRERWQAWRDGVLTSPDFQRRAARTWWMRPIARRRARALFDLVAGFVYSQVLLACVRLRLFDHLAAGPLSAAELQRVLDLPAEGTERLLAAAVALDLVDRRESPNGLRYGLGKLGAPMVSNEAVSSMVEHHAVLYGDLADPVALLKGGTAPALSRYWAYASSATPGTLPPEAVNEYSALMSASQPLVADEVLDAYDIGQHRCLLDVGGGQGRFLLAAARRSAELKLVLFDLPGVVPAALRAFAVAGVAQRAAVHGGDFTRDALPRGADVASLIRVIYDHPDERAATILRAVYDALPSGGTLLLAEPMAGASGARRMGDAYFNFYLLAMHGGRSRTAVELGRLVQAAGFEGLRELATPIPLQVSVLVARKT